MSIDRTIDSRATTKNRSPVSGAILIDKPAGITSHDVVSHVRRVFNTREVGHAGTLDPIATGLLICLLGEATKLSQYVMSEEKSYRVGIKFGLKTDSADISGKTVSEKKSERLETMLVAHKNTPDGTYAADFEWFNTKIQSLVGALNLPVPKYSAVKVAGRKLYEYARADEDVAIPVKEMVIKSALLIDWSSNRAIIDLHCEKGTYVRSWVEKLGELLECDATVETLRRTQSGPFDLNDGFSVEKLESMDDQTRDTSVIPMAEVLGGWPALKVLGRDEVLVRNGQIPKGIYSQILHSDVRDKGVRLLSENGAMLALVTPDETRGLKLARVFQV